MTNDILKKVCDEKGLEENVCGRCAKWGNQHTDDGRPVYTLACDCGHFTAINDTCVDFVKG